MPSLNIPESGLTLENSRGSSFKSGSAVPDIFGLTLADGVIEEMIKCVQNGKPITLSMGDTPNIHYGTKTQYLSSAEESIPLDVYQSSSKPNDEMASSKGKGAPGTRDWNQNMRMMGFVSTAFKPSKKPAPKPRVAAATVSSTAGADAALAQLQSSLASENAKKVENTTQIVHQAINPRKTAGRGTTNNSRFLSHPHLGGDKSRSMPTSPALSGVGSPALNPTSVPLSQQQAEQAKAARKPFIHLLAIGPISRDSLRDRIPEPNEPTFESTLDKVGDFDTVTKKWSLRKNYFKELDVWSFREYNSEERQKSIDNAVKIFDKSRMAVSEPQWDLLLEKHERGTGKCLSKIQAQIAGASSRSALGNLSSASGHNTPLDDSDDMLSGNRAGSQPPSTKSKKAGGEGAQAKRLFAKKPPKSASKPAPKTTTKREPAAAKKATQSKAAATTNSKVLSAEFVEDSDSDGMSRSPVKPLPKSSTTAAKRSRDEETEASDSSAPLAKKFKKAPVTSVPAPQSHRVSDASQSSRTTTSSKYSAASSAKTKPNTSPQKSSPLASSPPTNASDISDTSSLSRVSSSASPALHPSSSTKNSRSPIHKRPQKPRSASPSGSDSSGTAVSKTELMNMARRYKSFYPNYEKLYRELEGSRHRDKGKEEKLMEMHNRLQDLKAMIMSNLVVIRSP